MYSLICKSHGEVFNLKQIILGFFASFDLLVVLCTCFSRSPCPAFSFLTTSFTTALGGCFFSRSRIDSGPQQRELTAFMYCSGQEVVCCQRDESDHARVVSIAPTALHEKPRHRIRDLVIVRAIVVGIQEHGEVMPMSEETNEMIRAKS